MNIATFIDLYMSSMVTLTLEGQSWVVEIAEKKKEIAEREHIELAYGVCRPLQIYKFLCF